MQGPWSDLRVIDLSTRVAGPYCSKLFADAGAQVIKVERPGIGDPCRRVGPFYQDDPHPDKSALFLNLNTGKKSITLDLKNRTGKHILLSLIRDADLIIENFKPATMDRLGLSYEALEKLNPSLVLTSISNFGQSGPYRDFKAQEIVLFGMSGAMIQEGEQNLEPLKYAGNQAQYFAGTQAAAVTAAALTAARLQGIGQHVDISIVEAAAMVPQLEVARYGYSGHQPEDRVPRRPYYQHHGTVPSGIHPCKDGYVVFFGGAMYFPRVCELIGRPELAQDPRYATPEALAEHGDLFLVNLLDWFGERTVQEVVERSQAHRVPAAPMNRIEELFQDPQMQARDYWVELDHPVVGRQTYPGVPLIMPDNPMKVGSSAPLLGQHNRDIYQGILGLSSAELVLLREQSVI